MPDGVAQVRWTFANAGGKPTPAVEVPVTNNVAVGPRGPSTAFLLHARWYAANGSVVPTSDRALRHAIAVRQATLKRQAIRYDARHSHHAPASLLADFAVFTVHSRSGIRTAAGNIISKPRLSSLPLAILDIAAPNQPPQLDPEQMREVRTPSGDRGWIIPGARGLCLAVVDQPRFPFNRYGGGAGEACTASLARAESEGTGLSSGYPGGPTVTYGVVPIAKRTVRVWTGHGYRSIHPADGVYVFRSGPRHR